MYDAFQLTREGSTYVLYSTIVIDVCCILFSQKTNAYKLTIFVHETLSGLILW